MEKIAFESKDGEVLIGRGRQETKPVGWKASEGLIDPTF